MAGGEGKPGMKSFCGYGARYLRKACQDLRSEIEGARRGADPEHIHQMRVASRRLRAAMPIFRTCFPKRKYRKWSRSIRTVTSSLGKARDLDVQIAFLEEYLEAHGKRESPAAGEVQDDSRTGTGPITGRRPGIGIRLLDRVRDGIARLPRSLRPSPGESRPPLDLAPRGVPWAGPWAGIQGAEVLHIRMRQRRERLQPDVEQAIADLTMEGSLGDFERTLADPGLFEVRRQKPRDALFSEAYRRIARRVTDLLAYEPYVAIPDAITRHHEMRIAAKRLRYTLEIFSRLFGGSLKEPLRAIKALQDVLGEIHDCDVWIQFLPGFMVEERERTVAYFGTGEFFSFFEPGILELLEDRKKERERLYRAFVGQWDELRRTRFFENLRWMVAGHLLRPGEAGEDLVPVNEGSRIALCGDIRGDINALEAVAGDANRRGVAALLTVGDLAAGGPFPDEVLRKMAECRTLAVIGKNDARIRRYLETGDGGGKRKVSAAARTAALLSRRSVEFLLDLPSERSVLFSGIRIFVTGRDLFPLLSTFHDLHDLKAAVPPGSTVPDVVVFRGRGVFWARHIGGILFVCPGDCADPSRRDAVPAYVLLGDEPLSLTNIRLPRPPPGGDHGRMQGEGDGAPGLEVTVRTAPDGLKPPSPETGSSP